jgi:hypothetical protein
VKPFFFVAALCLAGSVASAQAQDVHISQRDRDEIRAVIRAATREPILRITAVYDDRPVAGSIPRKAWRDDGRNGKVKLTPIVEYERTDKVSVQTGSEANLTGGSYGVQKLGGKWKIVGKRSFWIH